MEKEELIKSIFENNSTDILELLFENAENDGTIMTPENRKGLVQYRKECDKRMLKFFNCLNIGCKKNQAFKNNLENLLEDYKDSIMSEHNYYNSCYYKQRSKRWCEINNSNAKIKF